MGDAVMRPANLQDFKTDFGLIKEELQKMPRCSFGSVLNFEPQRIDKSN